MLLDPEQSFTILPTSVSGNKCLFYLWLDSFITKITLQKLQQNAIYFYKNVQNYTGLGIYIVNLKVTYYRLLFPYSTVSLKFLVTQ